jgi:hypothetical protein
MSVVPFNCLLAVNCSHWTVSTTGFCAGIQDFSDVLPLVLLVQITVVLVWMPFFAFYWIVLKELAQWVARITVVLYAHKPDERSRCTHTIHHQTTGYYCLRPLMCIKCEGCHSVPQYCLIFMRLQVFTCPTLGCKIYISMK